MKSARKISGIRNLLVASTSVMAIAINPVLADETNNVAGIVSKATAEGADYTSVLRIPAGAVNVFGAEYVADGRTARVVVSRPKGDNGGAIRQQVDVERGDGGARLDNDGQTTIRAIAAASSERPRRDVSASALIDYAIRQDVDVDDTHSVDLRISNNNALTVLSRASGSFVLPQNGDGNTNHAALSVIRTGTLQHAHPGDLGNGTVALTNGAAATFTVSSLAELAPVAEAEGNPAQDGSAVSLVGRAVDQLAEGVAASASADNLGRIGVSSTATVAGSERARSLALIGNGVSQRVAGQDTAAATSQNGGTIDAAARSNANGQRRAEAGAVVLQGVNQTVQAGDAATASFTNTGTVSTSADAISNAAQLSRAGAFIGQVIGQSAQSVTSTVSITNSGLVKGTATANATSGVTGSEEPQDRALAIAFAGAPRGGLALSSPDFGIGLGLDILNRHHEAGYGDEDNSSSNSSSSYDNYSSDDDDNSSSASNDDHSNDDYSHGYHEQDRDLALPAGPLAGVTQVAIGSTATITNTGSMIFGSDADATGVNLARALSGTTAIDQISDGNQASASFSGARNSVFTATSSAAATADRGRAQAVTAGLSQQALGGTVASATVTSLGQVAMSADATSKAGTHARAAADVGAIDQVATADLATASYTQSGSMSVRAEASATGAAGAGTLLNAGSNLSRLDGVTANLNAPVVLDGRYASASAIGNSTVQFGVSQTVEGVNAAANAVNTGTFDVGSGAVSAAVTNSATFARVNSAIVQDVSGTKAAATASNSGQLSVAANSAAFAGEEARARSLVVSGVMQIATGDTASVNFANTGTTKVSSAAIARGDNAGAAAEIAFGMGQSATSTASSAVFSNTGLIEGTVRAAAVDTGAADGSVNAAAAIGAMESELPGALVSQLAIGSTASVSNTGQIRSTALVTARGAASANANGSLVNVAQAAEGASAVITATNAASALLETNGLATAEGTNATAQFQGLTLAQMSDGAASSVRLDNAGRIVAQGAASAKGSELVTSDSNAVAVVQSAYGNVARIILRNTGTVSAVSGADSAGTPGASAFTMATAYRGLGENIILDVVNTSSILSSALGNAPGFVATSAAAVEFNAIDGLATLTGSVSNSGTIRAEARSSAAQTSATTATGIAFTSGVNSATFTNTAAIETDVRAAAGSERASTGILVTGAGDEDTPNATFTINNNGGTIVSRIKNDPLGGPIVTPVLRPWLRGTAINTIDAPNAVVMNFNGTSRVYGNMEISNDDRIDVSTGELTFEGVVNSDRGLRGNFSVQSGATLYMVDPINRSADSGYAYEGPTKINVDTLNLNRGGTLALQLPTSSQAPLAQAQYPQIRANTARIAGTLEVRLPTPNGLYSDYFFDNVIDSSNLGGTRFDRVITSYETPLLRPEARYDNAENVDLVIDRIGFGEVPGLTYNQTQVGNGIERVYSPTQTGPFGTLLANLFRLSPAAYPGALDQLSGAEYGSYMQAVRNLSHQISVNVNDQLGCARDAQDKCEPKSPGVRLFAMAGYGASRVDFDGNSSTYDADGVHVLFGAGYGNGAFSLAAFAGYREVNVDFGRFGNSAESNGWQGGLVTGYEGRDVYVRANGNFTQLKGEMERNIAIGSTAGQTSGRINADVIAVNAEIGGRLRTGRHLFSPFIGLDFTSIAMGQIREAGVAGANLTLNDQKQDQTTLLTGLKWSLQSGRVVPEIKVAYRHDFNKEFFYSNAFFTDAPSGSDFSVRSPRIGGDSVVVGASLATALSKSATGRFGYLGRFNGQANDHAIYGSLVVKLGGAPAVVAAPAPAPAPAPEPAPVVAPEPAPAPAPAPLLECYKGSYLAYFEFDSATLTDGARVTLDAVVSSYARCGSPVVLVAGHTDRAGPETYNAKLSAQRAETVKAYLAERNVGEVITTVAKGELEPMVPTADGVRNDQNRRVEIIYVEGSDSKVPAAPAETPAAPAAAPAAEAPAATPAVTPQG
jgi:uncharacterized protein with beta-barrel porin domain